MTRDEAVQLVAVRLADAVEALRDAAGVLRGPLIEACPTAMRVEIALSRAIAAVDGPSVGSAIARGLRDA